jgi:hypothetical protein
MDSQSIPCLFLMDIHPIISKTYITLLRRGKYEVEALFSKTTSQNSLLF